MDDGNQYLFNFTFLHDYDVLIAENYTVKVSLPYGATNIKVDLPFEVNYLSTEEKFYDTLDFFGTPMIVFTK